MHYINHGPGPEFLQGDPNEFEKAGLEWCEMNHIEVSGCERNGIGPGKIHALKHELAQKFGGGARSRRRGVRKWDEFPICAYCEGSTDTKRTRPEIDHFRPRSRYKHLTFKWDNLMYACHLCNKKKSDKFPEHIGGYISPADPCSSGYFDYDIRTGKIRAHSGINDEALKAQINQTICDCKLNSDELCRVRKGKNRDIDRKIRNNPQKGLPKLLEEFTKRSSPFSSYARAYLAHLQASPANQ